jgi:hypothetical protein
MQLTWTLNWSIALALQLQPLCTRIVTDLPLGIVKFSVCQGQPFCGNNGIKIIYHYDNI